MQVTLDKLQEFMLAEGFDPYPDLDGFDISLWNEGLTLIDWPVVNTDPRKFKFCWVKCGEGTLARGDPGAYDYAIYERQMQGAESIGLAANAYWFWYYHLPWTLNPSAPTGYNYMLLDPTAQAQAFVNSMGPFKNAHPLLDIEDMYLATFLVWYVEGDTQEVRNKRIWAAIEFARKVNASLKKFFYEVWRLSGRKPDGYSGDWWMRRITKLLIDNGYGEEVAWINEFDWYLADYVESDGLAIPPGLNKENILAWQYKSTVKVDPVKGVPNGDRVDMARWMKSPAQFATWAEGTVVVVPPPEEEPKTMAGIPNKNIPTELRDMTVLLSGDDKSVDVAELEKYAPSTFFQLGYQGGPADAAEWYPDSSYPIRASRCKKLKPVAWIGLNVGYFMGHEWNLEQGGNIFTKRSMWDNKTLRGIIQQLRRVPFDDAAWKPGIKLSATDGGWNPLGGIALWMNATTCKPHSGGDISGVWQLAGLNDVGNVLTEWMVQGYIPKVPVWLVSSPEWFMTYEKDAVWTTGAQNLFGSLLDGVGLYKCDVRTEQPQATPIADLGKALTDPTLRPDNSYFYGIVNPETGKKEPFKSAVATEARIKFNFFTANNIRVENFNSKLPITIGMWFHIQTVIDMLLGQVTTTPSTDPTVDELKAKIVELEAQKAVIETTLASEQKRTAEQASYITQWEDWYHGNPFEGSLK